MNIFHKIQWNNERASPLSSGSNITHDGTTWILTRTLMLMVCFYSTVANVHCTLLYGGVFLSPFDSAFFSHLYVFFTFVLYPLTTDETNSLEKFHMILTII